jgi:hypothetical protein
VTWNWHAGMPVASYLVEDSVGNYSLTSRVVNGIRFYQAQDLSISAAQRAKNLAIMDMQPDITAFESQFNGPLPFASDGIIIGTPDASFDEEMEGMAEFFYQARLAADAAGGPSTAKGRPAGRRLHRAAPDPRPGQIRRGAAAAAAHVRRVQH